jgi:hypothetical protein
VHSILFNYENGFLLFRRIAIQALSVLFLTHATWDIMAHQDFPFLIKKLLRPLTYTGYPLGQRDSCPVQPPLLGVEFGKFIQAVHQFELFHNRYFLHLFHGFLSFRFFLGDWVHRDPLCRVYCDLKALHQAIKQVLCLALLILLTFQMSSESNLRA